MTSGGSLLYTFSLMIICGGLLYLMRQLYLIEKTFQKKILLHYYMSLKYPVHIYKIPEDEGGGYSVCIPQLGRSAFVGDGDSLEEALRNLEIAKEINFKSMIEKNIHIPLPQ
jgi:predicted RNase H-like HicB family nuclease